MSWFALVFVIPPGLWEHAAVSAVRVQSHLSGQFIRNCERFSGYLHKQRDLAELRTNTQVSWNFYVDSAGLKMGLQELPCDIMSENIVTVPPAKPDRARRKRCEMQRTPQFIR
jgi:hypothetical protein